MRDIIEKIEQTTGLKALYLVLIIAGAIILIGTIIGIIVKRKTAHTAFFEKEDFVHKMMKKDNIIKRQLTMVLAVGLVAAFCVLFFMELVTAALIVSYVLAGVVVLKLYLWFDEKYNRIEYNPRELQEHRIVGRVRVIAWDDVDKVGVAGVNNGRRLIFVSKRGKKIVVDLKRRGAYDFMIFCEKKLKGQNFEAIKIAQGRR